MQKPQKFLWLVIFLLNAQIAFGWPMYRRQQDKFLESLSNFANQNELGSEKFNIFLRKQGLKTRFWSKGGLGIVIDAHFCVSVKSDSNKIVHQGIIWTGATKTKEEVVYSDGVTIKSTCEGIEKNHLVVVIFTARRIYFINYRDHQAGYYERL